VKDSGDFRAITRPVLETARRFRETHRFLRGLFSTMGFQQTIVQYDRDPRLAGETKYPLRKMVQLALTAVLNFSTAPMKAITGLALAMWAVSLLYLVHSLYVHFVLGATVTGWTSLTILITFSTGLILICLNILGAYVGRIYEQGLGRPLYWLGDIRNIDITGTPPHIGKSFECEVSLSILRSRTLRQPCELIPTVQEEARVDD